MFFEHLKRQMELNSSVFLSVQKNGRIGEIGQFKGLVIINII